MSRLSDDNEWPYKLGLVCVMEPCDGVHHYWTGTDDDRTDMD